MKDKPHICQYCGNYMWNYRTGRRDGRMFSYIMHRDCMAKVIHKKKGTYRHGRYGNDQIISIRI